METTKPSKYTTRRRFCRAMAGLALGGPLLASCQLPTDFETPDFRIINVQLLPGGLFEQRLLLSLRIINPNDFALDIDGANMNLQLNGQAFGRGVSDQRVTVPRLGEGQMDFTVSTGLLEVVQQVMTLAERDSLDYKITGTAFLSGLSRRSVPYEIEGRFGLRDSQGGQPNLVPL
ncbi:MAG: LEA type 2 family protein [Pseudomonadota bacterium]